MNRIAIATLLAGAMSFSGCAGHIQQAKTAVGQAKNATGIGEYAYAEHQLAEYVYRDKKGHLKLKVFPLTGQTRKQAIDTVVSLLWETGRDETLKQFSDDYLHGRERQVTHCRIAERQAQYSQAFQCWNSLGEVDRAERVIRTEEALKILGSR